MTAEHLAWNAARTVSAYPAQQRLTPAELRVFAEAWPLIRGGRVLDIGVGAGRTVPYLASMSGAYTAVDSAPAMVAAARDNFPGVDIRLGDACELELPSAQFDFVLFSYNGIDCVHPDDRPRVLGEVFRVLKPGGAFAFSTHNKNALPADGITVPLGPPQFNSNPVVYALRMARFMRDYPRSRRNRQQLEPRAVWRDDIAFVVDGSHASSVLMGYVRPEAQLQSLASAGFELPPLLMVDDHGNDVATDSTTPWLHFMTRKPAA